MVDAGRPAPDTPHGAICARCAEPKATALASCVKCGYAPDKEEGITLSLILSQQFSTTEELAAAAADIRGGRKLTLTAPVLSRTRPGAGANCQESDCASSRNSSRAVRSSDGI